METPVDIPIKDEDEIPKWKKSTVVFVLGGPGSGKGTQCANVLMHFRYTHFSGGDLFRAEVRSGSEFGAMIQSIKDGKIVPSEITVKLLCKAMEESGNGKFLIDGFPLNEENQIVFDDVGREDDNLETLKKRFKVFVESTFPVVSYYESKGKLRKINAAKPSEEVLRQSKFYLHLKLENLTH